MAAKQAQDLDASVISLISDEEDGGPAASGEPSEPSPTRMETDEPAADLTRFLRKYGCGAVKAAHLKGVVQACSCTPYCLYLYMGVELDGDRTASVVLVRYLDQSLGASVVRPLLALQMSVDAGAAPSAAGSDAHLLLEALNQAQLPLGNLAAFYCDGLQPALCRDFLSQLKPLSPAVVSLCGLPAAASRACRAGLRISFSHVSVLLRELHHHYATFASDGSALEQLFAGQEPPDDASPDCVPTIRLVQKMAASWRALVDHFRSPEEKERAEPIRERLADPKVKLDFLFLSEALQPLRALQELQRSTGDDVAAVLWTVAAAVRSFAERILRPASCELLLRGWNPQLLHRSADLLPPAEVDVGSAARELLWATPTVDLGDADRRRFQKAAQAFCRAALRSLVESVPGQLRDSALRDVGTLLKHPERLKDGAAYEQVLPALCEQLRLCDAGSPEAKQLADHFLSAVETLEAEPAATDAHGHRWMKVLQRMKPTMLQKLLLTLVALPPSLHRAQVFAQMVQSSEAARRETFESAPRVDAWARNPVVRLEKMVLREGSFSGRSQRQAELSSSDEDAKNSDRGSSEESDSTDNSSAVVDLTHEDEPMRTLRPATGGQSAAAAAARSVYVVSSDEGERGGKSVAPSPRHAAASGGLTLGELVWGQVEGFSLWPAVVTPPRGGDPGASSGMTRVKWFGQAVSAMVASQSLTPFAEFKQNFSPTSFAIFNSYREAIFCALQVAALRCRKRFSSPVAHRERRLEQMMAWALGGFVPSGPGGLKPTTSSVAPSKPAKIKPRPQVPSSSSSSSVDWRSLSMKMKEVSVSLTRLSAAERPLASAAAAARESQSTTKKRRSKATAKAQEEGGGWGEDTGEEEEEKVRGRGGWTVRKGSRKSREQADLHRKFYGKGFTRVNRGTKPYNQPDQGLRAKTIRRIADEGLNIEEFCLCCGTQNVKCLHPLFKGSLCLACKDNFTETLYRYDDDGYQSYCTICCYGMEVVLCGNEGCCRSYCGDCVNILVGAGAFDSLKLLDPWLCYMCQPHRAHGALVPRADWSTRVQEVFANSSGIEFESQRVYPCIPASQRRPLRVLSLFDGIATGYVVLKELGLKLEKYVASEICEDSIAVSTINHDGRIVHVGDVRSITKQQLDRWGPFDLLIGGSPCNDLSIVNPIRKGIYEGTGRLFFDYYRILHLLKPRDDDPRPFFWLFENVVFMNTHDRINISRFLECNPVLVDAIDVSPAHRARNFWGNIPGMNRPIIASKNDKLNLQDCLELGRKAQVNKVKTITTNPNSLKQGKDNQKLPVLQNGREDHLWVTELERIFGFPKHYTDVRNMGKNQRLSVLGKSWSVPVVRHLLAPLKDYFACEELSPGTTSTSSSSSSSSSPTTSSPASPDVGR